MYHWRFGIAPILLSLQEWTYDKEKSCFAEFYPVLVLHSFVRQKFTALGSGLE